MHISELSVPGSFFVETHIFADSRGVFLEAFRGDYLAKSTGRDFEIKQVNTSVSGKGVLRGIHYADVPMGQAKYITVSAGAIIDYVVDVREGSPTFGKWTSIELDSQSRNAVFLSEGLGHAFLSLEENTVVTYLVSDVFQPDKEFGINPLDKEIGLNFPLTPVSSLISEKDFTAPSLQEMALLGRLPKWSECQARYSAQTVRGLN